jgi:hypothetical protein
MMREISPRHGLNFVREWDYKSPFEKAENNVLPSIYTMTVERLKMARLLKESKLIPKINGTARATEIDDKTLKDQPANEAMEKSKMSKTCSKPVTPSPVISKAQTSSDRLNASNTNENTLRPLNVADINNLMPQLCIPTGFTGTILIQPTIHIHSDHDGLVRYRGIMPKTLNVNASPGEKRRKM